MHISRPHQFFIRWILSGACWVGAAFVVYGAVAAWTGEKWPPLERIADTLSTALTLLGTAITAASVYFYKTKSDPPEPISYATAWIVVMACAIALGFLFYSGGLPIVVVNGFAIAGLGGALLRIHPNPATVVAKHHTVSESADI